MSPSNILSGIVWNDIDLTQIPDETIVQLAQTSPRTIEKGLYSIWLQKPLLIAKLEPYLPYAELEEFFVMTGANIDVLAQNVNPQTLQLANRLATQNSLDTWAENLTTWITNLDEEQLTDSSLHVVLTSCGRLLDNITEEQTYKICQWANNLNIHLQKDYILWHTIAFLCANLPTQTCVNIYETVLTKRAKIPVWLNAMFLGLQDPTKNNSIPLDKDDKYPVSAAEAGPESYLREKFPAIIKLIDANNLELAYKLAASVGIDGELTVTPKQQGKRLRKEPDLQNYTWNDITAVLDTEETGGETMSDLCKIYEIQNKKLCDSHPTGNILESGVTHDLLESLWDVDDPQRALWALTAINAALATETKLDSKTVDNLADMLEGLDLEVLTGSHFKAAAEIICDKTGRKIVETFFMATLDETEVDMVLDEVAYKYSRRWVLDWQKNPQFDHLTLKQLQIIAHETSLPISSQLSAKARKLYGKLVLSSSAQLGAILSLEQAGMDLLNMTVENLDKLTDTIVEKPAQTQTIIATGRNDEKNNKTLRAKRGPGR